MPERSSTLEDLEPDATPGTDATKAWRRGALATCLALVAVVVWTQRLDDGGGADVATAVPTPSTYPWEPCRAPQPRPAIPSDEEIAAANEASALARQFEAETGWSPTQARSLVDGSPVCGYRRMALPTMEDMAAFDELARRGEIRPTTVFHDAPDGEIVAYNYGMAGAVPVEHMGTFDVEAAIIAEHGCLALWEFQCEGPG